MTSLSQKIIYFLENQVKEMIRILRSPVPNHLFIGIIFAILIRMICVPNQSVDYRYFLSPWYDFIVDHGGFSAFRHEFYDYTPSYLYWLLIAATVLSGIPKILAIKLFAMTVDFVCAFFTYKIVKLKYPTGRRASWAFFFTRQKTNWIGRHRI